MNLGKLLGTGKSFISGGKPAAYREDKRFYLPQFVSPKNPFANSVPSPVPVAPPELPASKAATPVVAAMTRWNKTEKIAVPAIQRDCPRDRPRDRPRDHLGQQVEPGCHFQSWAGGRPRQPGARASGVYPGKSKGRSQRFDRRGRGGRADEIASRARAGGAGGGETAVGRTGRTDHESDRALTDF